MKDIVQRWLHNCLGITIPMENLGQELKDGVLLAKILKYYDVVNDKTIKYIIPTDNPLTCENNLRQLNIWFKLLDIEVRKETFSNIAKGKSSTCLHLLYELYIALHNKEKLYFINIENRKSIKNKSKTKHEGQVISQPSQKGIKERLSHNEIIGNEHNSKLYTYVIKQKESRKRRDKEGTSKFKVETLTKKENVLKKLDKVRNEDIAFVRNALTFSSFQTSDSYKDKILPTANFQSSAEEKNNNITLQSKIFSSFKDLNKECENAIMNSVWKVIEQKEKDQLKKQVTQNLLRQADYEKRASTKKFQNTLQEKTDLEKFLETKQKLEEDCKNLGFFSSCKTSEEEINYQIEMIKKLEIHRKLYAEKLKKRYKKRYSLCFQIINDIIDLAINKSHFGKEYMSDDLWSEWKQMFISKQPVLETAEDKGRKSAKISLIENESQVQYSDERNFEEYLYLIGDWIEHVGSDLIFDENIILGNVLHRLFDIKNPPPFIQKPANIPKYRVCAVLNGINDESDLMKFKSLLIKSKICGVDLKSAINFCIQLYKNEADIKEEPPTSKKVTNPKKAITSKQDDSKKMRGGSGKGSSRDYKIDKEIQTTRSLVSVTDSKELTQAAKIGMDLYRLETTENIPNHLKVEIIIEFLRNQPSINGWVIINFPCSLNEAYIIEKTLSGKKFPKKFKQQLSLNKTSSNSLHQCESRNTLDCWDKYVAKYSRLVQFPSNEYDNFVTYFTSFILAIKEEKDLRNGSTSRTKLSGTSNDFQSRGNSQILDNNEIKSLTAIYEEQGILNNFIYETMDLTTLKNLARLILKDFIFSESVPSVELFGEEALQLLTQATDPKGKKSPKKAKDDPAVVYEILKQNQSLDENQEELETEADEKIQSESEIEVKPGHKDWSFTELYIPEIMAVNLANSWEELELKYIKQTTEILTKIKQSQNLISPYLSYISQAMNKHFEDNKESQIIVKKFLNYFNSIPKKKRSDRKAQDELCRGLFTTEIKLWQITHLRKEKAEEKRKALIAQNWTAEEMMGIANLYVSLLQIEANRCLSTIGILHSYYSLMLGGNKKDIPTNIALPHIQFNGKNEDKTTLTLTISKILTDESKINMRNPMFDIIDDIFKNLHTEINKLKLNVIMLLEKYEKDTFYQIKEYREKKKADKKKGKHKKIQPDEEKMSSSALVETKFSDIKKLFLEWSYAVKSECDRTNCRIKIIKRKMFADIEDLEKNMTTAFHNLKQNIKADYLKHNDYIDKMCEVFNTAIIENTPVLNDTGLHDNFFPLEPYPFTDLSFHSSCTKLEEDISSKCFTIKQLKFISDKLKIVSPDGIINKNALLYIIEDLIFWEQENGNVQLFPNIWNEMSSLEFEKLFKTVYGLSDMVNWKEFIIYGLELQFPDMEDIINSKNLFNLFDKHNFGTVSYKDYMNIKLWFEQSVENDKDKGKTQATKEFLFSLFQTNEEDMNYSALILSFCKDFDQSKGFGKGIAYFFGQCVIVSDKGLYLEDIMRDYEEQVNNMIKEIINQIIFDVVNTHVGLKIEEIRDSTAEKFLTETKLRNINTVNITSGMLQEDDTEKVIGEIVYETEFKNDVSDSQSSTVSKEIKKLKSDKETQTISLSELLTDEYIEVNKTLRWTSKVPKDAVNSLLEATVYSVLSSSMYKKEIEDIVWKLKRILAHSEDDYIFVPWFMNQNIMQDLFSYVHSFKIFSFPTIIEGICEHSCT